MANTADIKKGLCFNLDKELYIVIDFQHVKPGKGPAFVRTKIKSLESGKTIQRTFNSGIKIDIQRIERREYQYLYKEGEQYHFMNTDNYEQTFIDQTLIDAYKYMKEGQIVEILFHSETETPLTVDLPAYVEMEITYTEPGEKGNTATNAFKDATIETGANVKVPLFIETGEIIKVDTRTGHYSERVKK
ncbi:MAG: elongation factor P [Bacteroidota bacterium]|nr:elongation factor P [Bacteroidota bacterium]